MVVVQVEWLAGRTPEQKEELVAGITDILGRVAVILDRGGAFVNGPICGEHRRASGVTQER